MLAYNTKLLVTMTDIEYENERLDYDWWRWEGMY